MNQRLLRHLNLALPLLLYFVIAIPATICWRERLNSDGVCYLHRAMLLAGGDFHDAISAYWSPGLIVSTVPLLKLGIDPLHAIHWTLLLWGAAYVGGAQWLFGTLKWNVIAGCVVAMTTLRMIGPVVTPDVLLGAAMMFYLALLLRRRWLLAGLVAGVGFWCKAYFLPFFLLQFPVTIALRRSGWRPLSLGLLGMAIAAGPWIGVLSAHEGHLIFSSATTRNRFMGNVAPAALLATPPDVSALPPDPFISNLEVTDHDAWPSWSPFESRDYLVHQLRVIANHFGSLLGDAWRLDHVGLLLLAAIVGVIWSVGDARWLAISVAIYVAGFMVVAYETRYVVPVLLPIGIVLLLMLAQARERTTVALVLLLPLMISTICVGYQHVTEKPPRLTYREIANRLTTLGLNGRFATNTWNRDKAACTAFFLQQKFIAMPNDQDAPSLETKLDQRNIRFLYRWFDPQYLDTSEWPEKQMRVLLADGMWEKANSIRLDSIRRLDVYSRIPR